MGKAARTSFEASDSVNTYAFNTVNQLTSAALSGGAAATMSYDALGRLSATNGSAYTQFAYSGDHVLTE